MRQKDLKTRLLEYKKTMTVRPGLWANTPTNVGVPTESDLANFGVLARSFPSGIPCYSEDVQTMYIWDPQDTTSPLVSGSTVPVIVAGVQVGTWHAVSGGTISTLALNTVVGATDSLKSTIPPINGVSASVKGYATKGDLGGGLFYWDAANVATDDGGTIIRPTAAIVGAWVRIYSGPRTLPYYGILPNDATLGTINSTRMNALLALGAGNPNFGPDLYAPPGAYFFNQVLTAFNLAGMHLYGCSLTGSTVFQYNGATDLTKDFLLFWGNDACLIEDIQFYVPPVTGHAPLTGFPRLNTVIRVTSNGAGGPGCGRNTFNNVTAQGANYNIFNGSDTNVDVNLDLNIYNECKFINAEISNTVTSNSNTNNTKYNNCTMSGAGNHSNVIKNFSRGTVFDNAQVAGYGALVAAGTAGGYFFDRTFGANCTIKNQVWELQESQPMLLTDHGGGGVFTVGQIILDNHHVTNSSIGGTNDIIGYFGAGSLILRDLEIAGHLGGGRITVNPPANVAGGAYQLETDGTIFLYDGATMNVRVDGNYPMAWIGSKPITATSLAVNDQTSSSMVLYAGKNGAPTGGRYECLAVGTQADLTTIKKNLVSSYSMKCEIPFTKFTVGGAVNTFSFNIYVFVGNAILDACFASIVVAGDEFAGPGITGVTLDVGSTATGSQGILLAFDATVTGDYGKVDTDLGPFFSRAQKQQNGRILSFAGNDTFTAQILLTINTTGATVDQLSQGKMTLWLNFTPLFGN